MTNTTNLELNIIEEHDLLSFQPINENMQILDTAINNLNTATADLPTLAQTVATNTQDITTAENDIVAVRNRVTATENDINDLQTMDTAQNNRLTALENGGNKYVLNDVPTTPSVIKTFIKTNVIGVADQYGMYRYTVTIPMTEFAGANNVKVVNALLYNDGLSVYGYSDGAGLVRAVVRDNNLDCVFVASENFTIDHATAVITAIGY